MAEWFFQLGGNALGPITAQRLAEMAADGRLAIGDLVRRDDQSVWVPAEQLPGLKFFAGSLSPPVAKKLPDFAHSTALSSRLSIELKNIIFATFSHLGRIPDWTLFRYALWRNHRETREAQVDYGRELFEAGAGTPQQREVLQALAAELATADAKRASALNVRRGELLTELATSSSSPGTHTSPAVDRLARLSKGATEIQSRLSLTRRRLLPTDATERRRIALGYAAFSCLIVAALLSVSAHDREREHPSAPAESGTVASAALAPTPVISGAQPATVSDAAPQPPRRVEARRPVTRLHNNGSSVPIFDVTAGGMFKNGTDMKMIFTVPDGTACIEDKAYIGVENDFKQGMAKIEILEGDYRGKKGWALRQSMQIH